MPSYKNGRVPNSALEDLLGTPNAQLRRDAANAWNRAWREVKKETGLELEVVGWNRTYAEQRSIFLSRYRVQWSGGGDVRWYQGRRYVRYRSAPAAIPGTSNHGWGTAVDIKDFGGYGDFTSNRRRLALSILRKHGFSDAEGRSVNEPWHFVYKPGQDNGKKKKKGLKAIDKRFSPLIDRVAVPTGRYKGSRKWSSRKGSKIKGVNVHHWAGTNMSGYRRLVESSDPASANYLILNSGELIGSVPEKYRAWTTSSFEADRDKITIEIQNETAGPDWRISAAAMNTLVNLIDELADRHEFTPTRTTVKGHRDYGVATACPGPYLYPRLPQVAELARHGQDWKGGVVYTPSDNEVVEDGYWGSNFTRALQKKYGTPVDGVVSGQSNSWKSRNPGLTTGWRWVSPASARGSQLILAMQKDLHRRGLYRGKLDGLVGPKFFLALQKKYGTPRDGKVSKRSSLVKAMQRDVNDS